MDASKKEQRHQLFRLGSFRTICLKNLQSCAWMNARSVMCLPGKHEDMSSDPSTWVKSVRTEHVHNSALESGSRDIHSLELHGNQLSGRAQ